MCIFTPCLFFQMCFYQFSMQNCAFMHLICSSDLELSKLLKFRSICQGMPKKQTSNIIKALFVKCYMLQNNGLGQDLDDMGCQIGWHHNVKYWLTTQSLDSFIILHIVFPDTPVLCHKSKEPHFARWTYFVTYFKSNWISSFLKEINFVSFTPMNSNTFLPTALKK